MDIFHDCSFGYLFRIQADVVADSMEIKVMKDSFIKLAYNFKEYVKSNKKEK